MNPDLTRLAPHPSKKLSELARNIPDAIDLTVGEPFWGPPAPVLALLAAEVTGHGDGPWPYSSAAGEPGFRTAVASYLRRNQGVEVDPQRQVLVTTGAAGALWTAIFALTAPGDQVLLADPSYSLYERIVQALGRQPVRIRTEAATGFLMDPTAVRAALGPRSRLLLVNSPENPTGAVYDAASLRALVDLTQERGLFLLHDEVLDFASVHGRHASALGLGGSREHVLSVNSCSKRFGVTGWRVGWLAGAAPVMAEAIKAHTFLALACPGPLQRALAEALAAPAVDELLAGRARQLEERAVAAREAWRAIGFEPSPVRGVSYYQIFDVRPVHARMAQHPRLAERTADPAAPIGDVVARALLELCGVVVVPGSAFGAAIESHIRVTFAGSGERILEAARRIERALGTS